MVVMIMIMTGPCFASGNGTQRTHHKEEGRRSDERKTRTDHHEIQRGIHSSRTQMRL